MSQPLLIMQHSSRAGIWPQGWDGLRGTHDSEDPSMTIRHPLTEGKDDQSASDLCLQSHYQLRKGKHHTSNSSGPATCKILHYTSLYLFDQRLGHVLGSRKCSQLWLLLQSSGLWLLMCQILEGCACRLTPGLTDDWECVWTCDTKFIITVTAYIHLIQHRLVIHVITKQASHRPPPLCVMEVLHPCVFLYYTNSLL